MRAMRLFFLSVMVLLAVAVAAPSFAQDHYNTPGLAGYDPVSYFTDGKPMRVLDICSKRSPSYPPTSNAC